MNTGIKKFYEYDSGMSAGGESEAEKILKKYNNTEYDSFGNPVYHAEIILKIMEEYKSTGLRWVKASEHGLPKIEVVTFRELITYGLNNGANIEGGMPWSFTMNGHPVTHENDETYLVGANPVHCTKNHPVVFINGNVYPYWKDNPSKSKMAIISILNDSIPDALICSEGKWCYWSMGIANVIVTDVSKIEWLEELSEPPSDGQEWSGNSELLSALENIMQLPGDWNDAKQIARKAIGDYKHPGMNNQIKAAWNNPVRISSLMFLGFVSEHYVQVAQNGWRTKGGGNDRYARMFTAHELYEIFKSQPPSK